MPPKKSIPLVEVWNGMTVKELAISAKRNIDDVLDVLHFMSKGRVYNKDHVLTTGFLISNIVKRLGGKVKLVKKDLKQENELQFNHNAKQ